MRANGTARVGFSMLATLLLGACGGSSDSQQTYNLQKAMADLVASGLTANVKIAGSAMVNGTMTPFSGSGTFTASPAVNALFNNGTALAQTQTYSSSLTTEHAPGPGGFLGEIVGVEYDVAQVLGTLSRYSDSTLSLSLGTIRVSVKVVLAPVDQAALSRFSSCSRFTTRHNHWWQPLPSITTGRRPACSHSPLPPPRMPQARSW